MDFEAVAKSICAHNQIPISSISKYQSGQVNKVFNVNDKYVIKIEGDLDFASDLLKGQYEKVELVYARGARVPRIIDHGQMEGKNYLLMEKVKGENLISAWWSFNDTEKENYIGQIAQQMEIFHSIKSDVYFKSDRNFETAVENELNFGCVDIKKLKPEYARIASSMMGYFAHNKHLLNEEGNAVFVHNDLHFENIFFSGSEITGIIDFDFCTYAPREYELKKILDFAHTPSNYVMDGLQPKYFGLQLTQEILMLKRHYPALFSHPHLIERVKILLIEELLWTIEGYQKGRWDENAMKTVQKKFHDWYESGWLEKLLN